MAFDITKLKRILDMPKWQGLNPIPNANASGGAVLSMTIKAYNFSWTVFCANATSALWEYNPEADACTLLKASGISGTFAAGFAAKVYPLGPRGTATAGSTTTLTTNLTIVRNLVGYSIRITAGTGKGDVRRIASNTIGANSVITVAAADAFGATIDATSVYQIICPRLYIFNPHTASTWAYFGVYEWATDTWNAALTLPAGLAAAWGTDAALVQTTGVAGNVSDNELGKTFGSATASVTTYSAGAVWVVNQWTGAIVTVVGGTGKGQVATIASNTASAFTIDSTWTALDATSKWVIEKGFDSVRGKSTITHTNTTNATIARSDGGTWTANSWTNSQVRVVGGTGAGQVKIITSNTTTTLTLSGVWTTALDATSIWMIEGCDDNLYLLGNNAVTMYKYSIGAATWATLSPGTARPAAPVAGMGAFWVTKVSDASWSSIAAIKNGRYIYSPRGSANWDVYDIALNAWAAAAIVYGSTGEPFGTGTCYEYDEQDNIYVATPGTTALPSRLLRLCLIKQQMIPAATMPYIQGTATVGDKLFNVPFTQDGVTLQYIYHWRNSGQELCRLPMWHTYSAS